MNRIIRYTLCAALLAMFSTHAAVAEEYRAVASNIDGKVYVSSYDNDQDWQKVRLHDKLDVGQRVKTSADASVTLSFDSGNVLVIGPLSIVKIEELSRSGKDKTTIVDVEQGRMMAYAQKLRSPESSFVVKTPVGHASVRGSEVVVTVTGEQSTYQVLSGAFDVVVNGKSALLEAGFQMEILASATMPPEPTPIEAGALKGLKKEMDSKREAGQQAENLTHVEDVNMDLGNDMMDIMDNADVGSCHMCCSSFNSDGSCAYYYPVCDH